MHVVLYQPQIPPNTGNIARLCVATQTNLHLIHPLGFKIDEASVKRAGLDYWQHLQFQEHHSWEAFLNFAKLQLGESNFYYYSKKVKRPYTKVAYKKDDCLIFGSETKGLPERILQKYQNQSCTIPMWGPTRSLNLATSVGIVLYEALRQVHAGFDYTR